MRIKSNNKTLMYIGVAVSVLLLLTALPYIPGIKKASITQGCDFTIKSIDEVKTVSNEPTLNNERVYLIDVRADKGGECLKVTLTQDDFARFGISDILINNITLSAMIQDLSLDYRTEDDAIFYKVYESTASDDLSRPIPYSSVSLKTTQLSALGQFTDPNGQAPKLNHLGNFPPGGDPNTMRDVTKLAYVQHEASNVPFGLDATGNWWVTHLGGIPYYRGYRIDTVAQSRYNVLFTLDSGTEQIASAVVNEQNRVVSLGDIARIKFVGSSIDSAFPPQPSRYYYIVQGLDGTPIKGTFKFVSSDRYERYKTSLDALVNFDNNYFGYSYIDMDGSLVVNSTPDASDIYIDNKYIGFTPLSLDKVPIGRHSLTAKKTGYYDATQEFNLNPTTNRVSITLAKIPPPDLALTLTPGTVTQGQTSVLSWATKGDVNTVKLLSPTMQMVGTTGSQTVNPVTSTTYTLSVTGIGGEQIGSARLQVNPPPPPPPAPPVNRDPGVGRESLSLYENELNNMLGLMYSETGGPKDCVFDKNSLVVTCRPQLPVVYPEFQIILKANAVAMEINAAVPKITKVDIPPSPLYEGTAYQAVVDFENIGMVADSFDVSLQSNPSLSGGTQQFTLPSGQSTTASIPFSGAEGTYKAKVVVQSRNNPSAKDIKEVEIKILKKPLPDEIIKLQKQTDILEDLIGQGFSKIFQAIGGILILIVIVLVVVLYRTRNR